MRMHTLGWVPKLMSKRDRHAHMHARSWRPCVYAHLGEDVEAHVEEKLHESANGLSVCVLAQPLPFPLTRRIKALGDREHLYACMYACMRA